MSLIKCPKCLGTGTIPVEKPVSMTRVESVQEKCDLCDGVGWVEQDLMPEVLARLDKLVELQTKTVEILGKYTDGGKT